MCSSDLLRWIETPHFRIGVALPSCPVGSGKEWLQQLAGELRALQRVLPRIDPKARQLDGWLRAHLVAARAERIYARMQARLGVDDAWFPRAPGNDPAYPATFRGLGPYLGMREKFAILLVTRGDSLQRYTAAFHARPTREFCMRQSRKSTMRTKVSASQ